MPELSKNYDDCFNKALLLISIRIHSSAELKMKLFRKFDDQVVEAVVARLTELKYLDDLYFATSYVELNRRKKSKLFMSQYLTKKGVERGLIISLFENYTLEDEYNSALSEVEKKRWPEDLKLKKLKIASSLQRKGFSYETIKRVIATSK